MSADVIKIIAVRGVLSGARYVYKSRQRVDEIFINNDHYLD